MRSAARFAARRRFRPLDVAAPRRGLASSAAPPAAAPPGAAGAVGGANAWVLAATAQPLLAALAGAFLVGGVVAAVGYRNDARVASLTAEMAGMRAELSKEMGGMRAELGKEMAGVRAELGKEMGGMQHTIDAKVAGVVATARAEAAAAAMAAVKDYGVAFAGGAASKA